MTIQPFVAGRRICVRLAYGHPAVSQLKSLGASWDSVEKAWWIGLAKRDKFEAILAAHKDEVRFVPVEGCPALWGKQLEEMKRLGGRFDSQAKLWRVPEGKLVEAQKLAEAAARFAAQRQARPGLASERQINVIRRCRDGGRWFDTFDGSRYGLDGPTNEELDVMSFKEASDLVGIILDGGV